MCQTRMEAGAHVLRLLLRGYSPEEVEELCNGLEVGTGMCVLERTALTDPTNVLMQEVREDGTRSG